MMDCSAEEQFFLKDFVVIVGGVLNGGDFGLIYTSVCGAIRF